MRADDPSSDEGGAADVEDDPSLLHDKDYDFFKKYLVSLGAKIPDAPKKEHSHEHGHSEKHGGGCCDHDHGGHDHGHSHSHSHSHSH